MISAILWLSSISGFGAVSGDEHWDNQFGPPGVNSLAEGIAAIHASEGRMMSVIPALQREVLLRNRIQR